MLSASTKAQKQVTSAAMKRFARERTCDACQRGNAMRTNPDGSGTLECRYCAHVRPAPPLPMCGHEWGSCFRHEGADIRHFCTQQKRHRVHACSCAESVPAQIRRRRDITNLRRAF